MLNYLALLCVFTNLVVAVPTGELPDINDDLPDITDGEPLPTPTGIRNFIGVGYNIIDGNPEGGDIYLGGVDPGLLVTRPILKLTYDENQLTSDREYIVPDQVLFSPRSSCVTTETQQTFYGTETYVEKISVDMKESGRVKTIFSKHKFSKSSRYEEINRGVETNRYVYYEDRTVCNMGQARYRSELAMYEQYPLDTGFVYSACHLPLTYDEETYMQFIDDWGTHVVTKVDLGSKSTVRFAESREDFVHFARTEVEGSVTFRTKIITGYRGALKVDTDVFETGLSTGQKFGSHLSNFTSGGDELPEPIAVELIGMHEVFDKDFWQEYSDYIKRRLCTVDWMSNKDTIQLNMEMAMNNYADWRGAEETVDPEIVIPIAWPKGTYTLPKPIYGCPNTHFTWAEGWRFHDTEDVAPGNYWSDPLHLSGNFKKNDMDRWFCSKTVEEQDIFNWSFQPGQYCVAKKGSLCPKGLSEGYVLWDDEDTSNDNAFAGDLPSGQFDHNTRIDYCCRDDGFASNPIYLPVDEPFFLLKVNHQCQEVVGMTYTEEYFRWDTNDQGNDDLVFGTHPYPGDTDNNILLDFCYYEPLQDEDV
eukprot:XP_797600.2 PREDICTED: uncharacterized protein LOC593009 [Strongylocentrotus purpuratus]